MNHCAVCGSSNTELHHIVFRSQAGYMANITHNHIYLCPEHHRGNNSPHMKRKIDLELKKSMQSKLENLFDREYYNVTDIHQLLGISRQQAQKIVKTLIIYKEGYYVKDIISRMMGGRLY